MTPSTIMRYGVATTPLPLQASLASGNLTTATLTVVASNPTGSAVKLEGVIVTIPVGNTGSDLTADAKSIQPVATDNWTLKTAKSVGATQQYAFAPKSGHGEVGGEGLTFELKNVEVNRQTGSFKLDILEGSPGSLEQGTYPKFTTEIAKFPSGWGNVAFTADPPDAPYDKPVVHLQWDGPQGAIYEIEYIDQNKKNIKIPALDEPRLPEKGSYPVSGLKGIALHQTTAFTLNVADKKLGTEYQVQCQKVVSVAPPPPKFLSFDASLLEAGGASTKLSWSTQDVSEIKIDGVVSKQGVSKGSTSTAAKVYQHFTATGYPEAGSTDPPALAYAVVGQKTAFTIDKSPSEPKIIKVGDEPVFVFTSERKEIIGICESWFISGVTANTVVAIDRKEIGFQQLLNAEPVKSSNNWNFVQVSYDSVQTGCEGLTRLVYSSFSLFTPDGMWVAKTASNRIVLCTLTKAEELPVGQTGDVEGIRVSFELIDFGPDAFVVNGG